MQALAEPGEIYVSKVVRDQALDKLSFTFEDMGLREAKNIARPIEVYRIRGDGRVPAAAQYQVRPEGYLFVAEPASSTEVLPGTPRHNLPHALTRFIGHDKELDDYAKIVGTGRLVTLTGSGGCGKTRLAVELASRLLAYFPDGAWFVDLAPIADPERLPLMVARTFGVTERPDQPLVETLCQHVSGQQALVVVDNCEHLVGACATLVATLLHRTNRLHILATSREALGLPGEQTLRVRSLSCPPPHDALDRLAAFEAVQLFADRARLVQPDFAVDARTAPAVAEICRRLDGIPLAIELAAARTKILSIDELRKMLDDRFRLLVDGSRTAPPRLQTLLAAIKWSFDLLTLDEQQLLERLSVFAGGWTLAAATAIAGNGEDDFAMLERLTRLADKSLIAFDYGCGSESRYSMLETIRQYAVDQIAADGLRDVRVRHARFFAGLGADYHSLRRDSNKRTGWLTRIDADHENVLAAHAASGLYAELAETGLELVSSIEAYWESKGLVSLAWQLLSEALGREAAQRGGPSRCRALTSLARVALVTGRYDEGERVGQDAMQMAQALSDEQLMADVLANSVSIANCVRRPWRGARSCRSITCSGPPIGRSAPLPSTACGRGAAPATRGLYRGREIVLGEPRSRARHRQNAGYCAGSHQSRISSGPAKRHVWAAR